MDRRLVILFLILTGFLVYGRSFGNGLVGDDPGYIHHPFIRNFQIGKLFGGSSSDLGGNSPITGAFYRPASLTVLALISRVSGGSPAGYHLIQLFIHMANTYLVYLLLKKFTEEKSAFILSLFFLVHPINSEAVLYISNMQDVLFMSFGLAAIWMTAEKKHPATTTGLLLLSLLSKETGIIFAVLVPLYAYFSNKKELKKTAFAAGTAAAVYLLIRAGIGRVGAGGVPEAIFAQMPLYLRLLSIPKIMLYYIQTLIWPARLAIAQTWIPRPGMKDTAIPVLLLTAAAAGMAYAGVQLRKKKPEIYKWYVYFACWTVLAMAMHLQIMPLEMTVADRWLYPAMAGLLGMAAAALPKRTVYLAALIIPLLAARSWVRTGDWKSALTLYAHDSRLTESHLLEAAYGFELMNINETEEAGVHLTRSVELHPTSVNTNSLGVWYFRQQNPEEAISWFEKSVSLGDNFQAYNNLARLLLSGPEPEKAMPVIVAGSEKWDKSDNFWYLLALARYKSGDNKAALEAAQKAASISASSENMYVLNQLQEGKPILFND